MEETTIPRMLRRSVRRFGDRPALEGKKGAPLARLTYAQLEEAVRRFARGLAALGISQGDRIALLSENRPEWAIADLAAQSLGVVTVPIYSTLPAPQVRHLLADSAARVLVVSDRKQLAKAQEAREGVRALEHLVAMDAPESPGVLSFAQLMERGDSADIPDKDLDARAEGIRAEDLATLIYTSGTTGDPKGAMLTHRALLHTAVAAREIVRLDENDVFLSFLPLCHVIERVGGHYLPLAIGARIVYSEGVFAIAQELPQVQPTVFLCVPRLYESMREKVREGVARMPERRRRLALWALDVGRRRAERAARGEPTGLLPGLLHALADRLVLSRIREQATGGRIRFLVSGGAPLSPHTAAFFQSIGIEILEGYGLTELPVISLNRPGHAVPGTVGPPIPGIQVRIAEDGEILARGPSLMNGYFGKPEATAEAIDGEGWLHTGDVGEWTASGALRITDRKKDILVLANGKNVAPQPIEARLKESPYIAEAVLLGDRMAAVAAIIVPAFDRLRHWARDQEIPATDMADLVNRAETRRLIKDEIDRLTADLADFERIKRFALAPQPFTIEGGELTPTLKVRRKVVLQKYADLVSQLAR